MFTPSHLSMQQHPSDCACRPELIVHRDLKPSNILLTLDMSGKAIVRLADFGSAADAHKGAGIQVCGGVLGPSRDAPAGNMAALNRWICTVLFAAPEILLGGVEPEPFYPNTGSL